MTTLRPYQIDALERVAEAFAAGARRVLLVMPTGAGKTVCFAHVAEHEAEPTAIIAHRRELIRQASGKLRVRHGVIAPGYPATPDPVQVGSIQTLARRLNRLRQFGLIILDEAHHSVAGQWAAFLDSQPGARVLGVTATPERLDGRGLADRFDALVLGPSVADLVADGYLSACRVFAPPIGIDVSAVHTLAGDFNSGELADAVDKPSITGDAVAHYGKHCPGESALVSCVSVAHAEHVAAAFRAEGWRAHAVHGALPVEVRDERIGSLASGSIVTFCDLISEGLDVPAVGAVINLRPTQSLALYLQIIGRGMRSVYDGRVGHDLTTREGRLAGIASGPKPCLTVLDHAGNVLRHGMPDAPREWTLAGVRRRDRTAPPVRQCPECYAAHSPAAVCPACGHAYEPKRVGDGRGATLEHRDGELREVTTAAPLPPLRDVLKACRTYDDVEAVRVARGYVPAWTRVIMKQWRIGGRGFERTTALQDFAA